MAFCKNCGTSLPENATFCSSCGTPTNENPNRQNDFAAQQVNVQPLTTDEADIKQNKVYAILAYIGILVLIPFFAAKNSKFARYHTKQGLLLVIPSIAYGICTAVINAIVNLIFPPTNYFWYVVPNPIASLISVILTLGSFVFLALAIVGIVNAAQNKCKEIPVFGKMNYLDKFLDKFYNK